MKQRIYTTYDVKAELFMTPFFLPNDATAIRRFTDAVNTDTPLAMHPEDYTLFVIGEFSERDGTITLVDKKCLGCAIEFVKEKENA